MIRNVFEDSDGWGVVRQKKDYLCVQRTGNRPSSHERKPVARFSDMIAKHARDAGRQNYDASDASSLRDVGRMRPNISDSG